MSRFAIFCLCLAACAATAFDPTGLKVSGVNRGVVFETNEFKDGVLHLKDSAKGKFNNFLEQRFVGRSLAPYLGKRIVFSAEIRQLAASRAGTVGISLNYKKRDGKSVYRCFTPESIRADLEDSLRRLGTDYIDVYITHRQPEVEDVPQVMDTLLSLKKEAESNGWSTGTGNVMRRERKPLFWRWSASPGTIAEIGKSGLAVATPGRITLSPADGKALMLSGSTPDQARLVIEVTEPAKFRIDFLSFGKSNRSVEVDPAATDKTGRRRVSVPLEKFAPFQDLAQFEGLALTVEQPQTFVSIDLTGLDNAREVVNILPDPSFEEAVKPESNYNLWGDYFPEKNGEKFRYDNKAYHGRRSLLIEPGGFFTWYAHDQRGKGAVFSHYTTARSARRYAVRPSKPRRNGSDFPSPVR